MTDREMLHNELRCAKAAYDALPQWKKDSLHHAHKAELRWGYVRDDPHPRKPKDKVP